MEFETHNDDPRINIMDTSFRGYANTTYRRLVEVFGEPMAEAGADTKTTAEWYVRFEDGVVATIYDYRDPAPRGANHDWHIGGRPHTDVVDRIRGLVGRAR